MADREKLIELLCEAKSKSADDAWFSDATYAEQLAMEADHLIANSVTVQEWIPVTERLPEDDLPKDSKVKIIKVLVSYNTSIGIPVVRTQTRQKGRLYHKDEWTWAKFEPITHWMPLPTPPKGE